jgi:hypothetical protein
MRLSQLVAEQLLLQPGQEGRNALLIWQKPSSWQGASVSISPGNAETQSTFVEQAVGPPVPLLNVPSTRTL